MRFSIINEVDDWNDLMASDDNLFNLYDELIKKSDRNK